MSLLGGILKVNMFLVFGHRVLLGGLYPSLSSVEGLGIQLRGW